MINNFFSKLAISGSLVFLVFFSLAIYSEIKTYGLLNYSLSHTPSEIKWDKKESSDFTTTFRGQFQAKDDFLGSLTFHAYKLSDSQGQVVFRIKKIGSNDWLATNSYDFYYFNTKGHYTLGFPQIPDSRLNIFEFEFEFNPESNTVHDYLNTADLVSSKYVFPRSEIANDKRKLIVLVARRLLSAAKNVDYLKTLLSTILVTSGITLVITVPKNLKGTQKVFYLSNKLSQINPFYISLCLVLAIVYALLQGKVPLAEKLTVWLWLSLLGSIIWQSLILFVDNYLEKILTILDRLTSKLIGFVQEPKAIKIFFLIVLCSIAFSSLSKTWILGGDDSRIFYAYPNEYITNFASKIVSDTGVSELVGFLPPRSILPFATVLQVFHTVMPWANLQSLLTVANIWAGLIFFFCLQRYILRPKNVYEYFCCAVASFAYVFSIFNFYVLFNSKLLSIYLLSIYPLSIWLLLKAVSEKKPHFLIPVGVVWSLFSMTSVSFPWSTAALLVTIPFLLFLLRSYWMRLFRYSVVLLIYLILLNFHWLVYAPNSGLTGLSTQTFRNKTRSDVEAVSKTNNPLLPLLNLYHQKIQIDNNWPYLPIFKSWYTPLLPVGIVFISVVLWAGINTGVGADRKKAYLGSVCGLLLGIYFFTVNITPWGIGLFALAIEKIPGFVVFRNMFDKFSYPLAFFWGLSLGSSLVIVKSRKALFVIFVAALLWSKPYVLGEFDRLPLWTTKDTYNSTTSLNTDYKDLVKFIHSQPSSGRYLSLPLQSGNSATIQDEFLPNHYYNGVSPLLLLSGKNDLSGLLSFGSLGPKVFEMLKKQDFENIGYLVQSLGVDYVIVNNIISEDLQHSFVYSDGLYSLQTPSFIHSLLGKKVNDFGQRYSLYEINPKYQSEKISLSSPEGAKIEYTKNASHQYSVSIHNLKSSTDLIFLDPYNSKWKIYTPSGREVFTSAQPVSNLSNRWRIETSEIKKSFLQSEYTLNADGSINTKFKLYFQPFSYYYESMMLSVAAYLILTIYFLHAVVSSRR